MRNFARWAVVRVCVLLTVFSGIAHAQTQAPETKEDVKIEVSPEGTLVLVFADGREAKVLSAQTPYRPLPVGLNMTENMCAPQYGRPSCSLIVRIGIKRNVLVWTKHSDSSKLGKIVGFKSNGFGTDRILEETINAPEANGTNEVFVCQDYRWLTGRDKNEINRNDLILSWGAEGNFANGETMINENLTISGGFNLELTAVFGRLFILKSSQYISLFENGLSLLGAGPVTLALRNRTNQEICQVQFSPDISKAVKVSGELQNEIQKAPLAAVKHTETTLQRFMANLATYAVLPGKFE